MASHDQIEIRPVVIDDLDELSQKHPSFMPGYYTSALGSIYLKYFFWPAILAEQSSQTYIARHNKKIVGFLICTKNAHKLKRAIIARMFFLGNAVIIFRCLFSKLILTSTIENFHALFRKKTANTPDAELFLIGVDSNLRGHGIGKLLMVKMAGFFAENKIDNVFLRVKENNSPAISLYEKMGYHIKSHVHEMDDDWVIMTTSTEDTL